MEKINLDEISIHDNTIKHQYEMKIQDRLVKIEYIKTSDKIFLTHTEVPVELGGHGIGQNIVKRVLDQITESNQLKLVPLCPFVAGFIQKHLEYKSILAPGINV